MDINNMELLNDSGLSSLSGFSYQIKVFILRLTQLQQGQRVEFETLDDVAVRSLSSKDSISDSCFKWKVDETSSIEVFQVKQTNVSESVRRQVLYNWLLAYNQKPDISKFTLYVAQGYSINEKAFTNDSEKEYQTIIESDKAVTALVSRVKQIYKDDLTKFKRDYQTICSKSTIERLGDIDELIAEQLITPFHATAADIGKTYVIMAVAYDEDVSTITYLNQELIQLNVNGYRLFWGYGIGEYDEMLHMFDKNGNCLEQIKE